MDQPKSEVLRTAARAERARSAAARPLEAVADRRAALALIAWAGSWVHHRWTHIYVDDARIDGEVVTIASRVSGWITELPVIEGDEVKKGQVIARVDDRDSQLQREVLQARLKTIESQIGVMRAQIGAGRPGNARQVPERDEPHRGRRSRRRVDGREREAGASRITTARSTCTRRSGFRSRRWSARAPTTSSAEESHRKALADVAAARGALSAAGGSRKQVQVMQQQVARADEPGGRDPRRDAAPGSRHRGPHDRESG